MRRFVILFLFIVLVAGCQKVNMEKSVKIEPTNVVAPFIIDGPSSDQNVTLLVTPQGGTVDVFITTVPNADEYAKGEPQIPTSPITTKTKIDKEETITATIPAKKPYAIVLANASKPMEVKVKLVGK